MLTEETEDAGAITVEYDPCFVLGKGFYLLDENLRLKTKDVTKGKPGETRRVETVPICLRTIAGAKDCIVAASGGLAILCVSEDGFRYPCQ